MLIDGPPKPMLPARDANGNLIQVPLVSPARKMAADLVGKALAELQRPLPDRLMADQDPSGREHLLNHAQAQGEAELPPDGMADHCSRKAMPECAFWKTMLRICFLALSDGIFEV